MNETDLLLINPPCFIEEPDLGYGGGIVAHTRLSDKLKISAMNSGILSIASDIDSKGYSVKILDLSSARTFDELEKTLKYSCYKEIGVSC